jgi:hypothetical protein
VNRGESPMRVRTRMGGFLQFGHSRGAGPPQHRVGVEAARFDLFSVHLNHIVGQPELTGETDHSAIRQGYRP